MRFQDFLKLIRISQWYKNILIFIPLIFSLNFFNSQLLFITFLGFLALCLISSSYYIINDLKDIEKDKFHPEKNNRPLPSGKISKKSAVLICISLFISSLILSYFLSKAFFISVIILFLSSQLYTFWLRNIAFFDIMVISFNFIIRTVSGVFLLDIPISHWLILSAFFLSIFLVSGKRISEINLENLSKYRPSLNKRHKKFLTLMAIISIALVIIFFSLYAINFKPYILLTLPVSFYMVWVYFNNVYHYPEKIRNPEKFIFDKKILISLLIWGILLILSLYVL